MNEKEPKEKTVKIKVSKAVPLAAVYFKEGAFIKDLGSVTKIDEAAMKTNSKMATIEAYLQPNGQVWCKSKTGWMVVPDSNVKNVVISGKLEVELT